MPADRTSSAASGTEPPDDLRVWWCPECGRREWARFGNHFAAGFRCEGNAVLLGYKLWVDNRG